MPTYTRLALAAAVGLALGCAPAGERLVEDEPGSEPTTPDRRPPGGGAAGAGGAGSGGARPGAQADAAPASPDAGAPTTPDPVPAPDAAPVPEGTTAVLELHALDLWARPLAAGAELTITRDGAALPATLPTTRLPLDGAARFTVHLSAPEHEAVAVTLAFDGARLTASDFTGAGRAGLALEHGTAPTAGGGQAAVHRVHLGLRHRWFSAEGRPPRAGNDLELLMDGEEAWRRVHGDLGRARDRIHVSTWWWESAFELLRPEGAVSPEERRGNTILSLLEASPATKRVLVNQLLSQDGVASWITSDAALRAHGPDAGDRFELMGQANETSGRFELRVEPFRFSDRVRAAHGAAGTFEADTPIESNVPTRLVDLTDMPLELEINHASYHQKFLTIDDDLAFVGGMNLRKVDWDTSAHRVFEPRRMNLADSDADRLAVAAHDAQPSNGPRKDYMVRIEGPAAQDVNDVFKRRWDLVRGEGVEHAAASTTFEIARDVAPRAGGVTVQVTATLPDPIWEHSIAESWLNAVANAERYIFIEDQYFRAPMLNRAILERMAAVPELVLVVITKPVSEWTDPGCAWTHRSDSELRSRFPSRYFLFQLRSFDTQVTWGWDETESRFVDIDVHSKMLIVDDTFLSVGSANKNNRGMIYEGEMNLAVVDRAWVTAARRRILENLLPPGAPVDGAFWHEMNAAAAANDRVFDAWAAEGNDLDLDGEPLPGAFTPRGFLYSLAFRDVSQCLVEDVGEDMFKG